VTAMEIARAEEILKGMGFYKTASVPSNVLDWQNRDGKRIIIWHFELARMSEEMFRRRVERRLEESP